MITMVVVGVAIAFVALGLWLLIEKYTGLRSTEATKVTIFGVMMFAGLIPGILFSHGVIGPLLPKTTEDVTSKLVCLYDCSAGGVNYFLTMEKDSDFNNGQLVVNTEESGPVIVNYGLRNEMTIIDKPTENPEMESVTVCYKNGFLSFLLAIDADCEQTTMIQVPSGSIQLKH